MVHKFGFFIKWFEKMEVEVDVIKQNQIKFFEFMTVHGHEKGTKKFENDATKFIKSLRDEVHWKSPSDLSKESELGLEYSIPKLDKMLDTNILKAEVTPET